MASTSPPPKDTSKTTTYLTGHTPAATQHHEWRTAENSASHLLPTLISKASSNPHLTLLDIGAGSGTITASLAKYLPSGGTITAFDQSPEILSKAAKHAKDVGMTNITFKAGDAYNLPFPNETFDVVHASMLLAHLSNPLPAIKEMIRVCKKDGGVVSLRESDLRGWSYWPEEQGIKEFNDLLCRTHILNGGFVNAGQRLLSWVLETGIVQREKVKTSAGTWCFSTDEEKRVWGGTMIDRCVSGRMKERALKEGFAREEDFMRMKEGWERWVDSVDAWFGCMNGEVLVFL